MECEHKPTKVVTRFDDAWMGSYRKGSYENRTYEPIICKFCGLAIKANKELTSWVAN